MKLLSFYIFALILTITSCEKIFIPTEKDTPKEIFQAIWSNYDSHYAGFIVKNIDWDSIYAVYGSRINNNLNDNQLFDLLTEMLSILKDQHVWLQTDKEFYSFEKPKPIYYFYPNILNTYITGAKSQGMYTYGMLESNIGYFHVSTFNENEEGYYFIDDILERFKKCTGIVIDVRSNAGGSDIKAGLIASKFYDKTRNYSYFQTRNGIKHSDFSERIYSDLKPAPNARPDIPVVLLTDQSVGSAGEDFTLMLRVLPQVTVVGDYTGANPGGAPRPMELQNGWIQYIPTGLQYTMDDELFIDKGIIPDVFVIDQKSGKDMMIERAIEILK
jgi:C-terminal processing protease CtpA/Prc